MNIAVYVTSNYSNYDEFSKLLPKYLSKYTQSPVLLTANSRSTKDGHGNKLVKRYADEHNLKCKVYETEWNRWRKSAGSIASYHLSHNSEHSVVFWDGLSKGCKNMLQMAVRLNRPCDLVRINPSVSNIKPEKEEPVDKEPEKNVTQMPTNTPPSEPTASGGTGGMSAPAAAGTPSAGVGDVGGATDGGESPNGANVPSVGGGAGQDSTTANGADANAADGANGTDGTETDVEQTPTDGTVSTAMPSNAGSANNAPNSSNQPTVSVDEPNSDTEKQPPNDIEKEFVKNTTTIQPNAQNQQQSQNATAPNQNNDTDAVKNDTEDGEEENKVEQ